MPLTIGFDATAALQPAGIGRYTRQLLSALSARPDDLQYRLFAARPGASDGALPDLDGRFRVRCLPIPDRVLNAVWHRARLPLPVQALTGPIDLYHSPDFTLPPALGRPTVLTVYDLAFFRVPDQAFPSLRAYLERAVPRSVRLATRVIAISESTRRDLIDLTGARPERVSVVYPAASAAFRPSSAAAVEGTLRRLAIDDPYILSVGTLEPRKNYVRLLEAYARLRERGVRHRLVFAGRRGWMCEPIFERLQQLALEPHVSFVRPDDQALAALYTGADAFVYPSVYEGFGIPVLEALACGAPVACGNTSSLPEAVGEAGLLFDPRDVEAIAACLERLLEDGPLRQRLGLAGPAQAARFSWDESAARTVRTYHEAAGA